MEINYSNYHSFIFGLFEGKCKNGHENTNLNKNNNKYKCKFTKNLCKFIIINKLNSFTKLQFNHENNLLSMYGKRDNKEKSQIILPKIDNFTEKKCLIMNIESSFSTLQIFGKDRKKTKFK